MNTITVPCAGSFEETGAFTRFTLEQVPWPDAYPYKPDVSVAIAHSDSSVLLRFEVSEKNARAVTLESNGPVWEDSCVEFFVKAPGSEQYFNFETNCIGTGLAAKRRSRSDFEHFGAGKMEQVVRRSSLPHAPLDLRDAVWSLELEVPFALLDCGPRPGRLLANFYKCGDKTAVPHFVSWNPVLTPAPDFHRPEFFGTLELLW